MTLKLFILEALRQAEAEISRTKLTDDLMTKLYDSVISFRVNLFKISFRIERMTYFTQ